MWQFYLLFLFFTSVCSSADYSLKLTDEEADRRQNRVLPSPNVTNKCVYISECGYPGLKSKNGHEIHRTLNLITGLPEGYGVVGVPERKTWKHIVILTKLVREEIVVFNKKTKKTFYIGRSLTKVNGVIKCHCTEYEEFGETIWIQNIRPADPNTASYEVAAVDMSTGRVYHIVPGYTFETNAN